MSCEQHQVQFLIKNTASGLVFDGSEFQITLQKFTGDATQYWTMECINGGKFVITNVGNKSIIDVEYGASPGARVTVYGIKHGEASQQWRFYTDGSMLNADSYYTVEADGSEFTPGTPLVVNEQANTSNQLFEFEYVDKNAISKVKQ